MHIIHTYKYPSHPLTHTITVIPHLRTTQGPGHYKVPARRLITVIPHSRTTPGYYNVPARRLITVIPHSRTTPGYYNVPARRLITVISHFRTTPGPGHYNVPARRLAGSRGILTRGMRDTVSRDVSPGPGEYVVDSEVRVYYVCMYVCVCMYM
jgi:hypothetical protein